MIFLDGIIYSLQKHGGVSTYFDMLVKELEHRKLNYRLQHFEENKPVLAPLLQSKRLLERYRRVNVSDDAQVFLSSYFRLPEDDRIPTVTTVHDFAYEAVLSGPKVLLHRRQKFASIRRASDIICVSNATKADLYKYFGKPEGRVHVVHNGVSQDYSPSVGSEGHDGFLLYVGNRRRYKNFTLLLETLPLLPKFDLVCVGGEPWTDKERAETESLLNGSLYIESGIASTRLNELYNAAVCLVYPSLYEGFGIPVIEAMRAGCPVVAANCVATKEAGGDALLVSEGNAPGEMAEQIRRCVSSDRSNIVDAGISQASKYSWEKTHAATTTILKRYLTG